MPFARRPSAGQIFKRAKRGDHLVIAKLDRGFRSTKDCLLTLEAFENRGVIVHLLDINVDTSTPMGKLLIGIMSAVAQWEAQRIGERIRDAFRARLQRNPNRAVTAVRIVGYAIDADGNLSPHAEERAAGSIAATLRDSGLNYFQIAAELNNKSFRRPANPKGPKAQRVDRQWTPNSVKLLIQRARAGWPINPFLKEQS